MPVKTMSRQSVVVDRKPTLMPTNNESISLTCYRILLLLLLSSKTAISTRYAHDYCHSLTKIAYVEKRKTCVTEP